MRNAYFCTLRVLLTLTIVLVSNSTFATSTLPRQLSKEEGGVSVRIDILQLGDPGYLANNPNIAQLNLAIDNNTDHPIQYIVTEPRYDGGIKRSIQLSRDIVLPPVSNAPTFEDGATMGIGVVANFVFPGAATVAAAKATYNQKVREAEQEVAWGEIVSRVIEGKTIPASGKITGLEFIPTIGNITSLVIEYKIGSQTVFLEILLSPSVEVATNTPATP